MVMNKFKQFTITIACLIFGCIITYLTTFSFIKTAYMHDVEDTYFLNDTWLVNLLAVAGVILAAFLFERKSFKISDKFMKIYVICMNILAVWFVLGTQFTSVDDQGTVLSIASGFLQGNYSSWNYGGYAFRLPHQNGIILIYAFLSWIFGDGNIVVFQLLNVLFIFITYWFIYKIFRKYAPSDNTARLIMIALYTYLPYLMFTAFVYGTLIGLMFIVVGIYYALNFLETFKIKDAVVAIITIALSVLCKSNFYIHLIALGIVIVISAISDGKNKMNSIKKITLLIAIIAACLMGRIIATEIIEQKSQMKVLDGTPATLYIAMGLQEGWKAPGWNNIFNDYTFRDAGYDAEYANEVGIIWIKRSINQFITNPKYACSFFSKKLGSIWINPTFECFEQIKLRTAKTGTPKLLVAAMDIGSPLNSFLTELMDAWQSVIYFGALMYCILRIRKIKLEELLFAICFIGIFIFHIFWEARGYYTLPAMILLIPYAVLGYRECVCVLENLQNADARTKFVSTKIGLCGIVLFVLIAGFNVFSLKYLSNEKELYKNYLKNCKYSTRLDNLTYRLIAAQDETLVLDLQDTDIGTKLVLSEDSDKETQVFKIHSFFVKNGENYYYISSRVNEHILYLRDEADMIYNYVYTQEYSNENKNLCTIEYLGDKKYIIRNYYGLALGYNISNHDVMWIPYTGEDNQIWIFDLYETAVDNRAQIQENIMLGMGN